MTSIREIKEGIQEQGVEEEITYTLTVPSTWGTPTGMPTVTGFSYVAGVFTDVTSTIFPAGSASVNSQVITLPECKSMTQAVRYRIEVKFSTSEGNVCEAFAWVDCTR